MQPTLLFLTGTSDDCTFDDLPLVFFHSNFVFKFLDGALVVTARTLPVDIAVVRSGTSNGGVAIRGSVYLLARLADQGLLVIYNANSRTPVRLNSNC